MELKHIFKKLSELNVLIIGETILDEYIFVKTRGTASKDPIISTKYVKKEKYLGGIFAPARHLANFVNKVHVLTYLGDIKRNENFIKSKLKENISYDFFTKKNSPTIIKRRFVEPHHLRKLFKVEFINDSVINKKLEKKIIKKIQSISKKYDIILVNDFGHGFINKNIINTLIQSKKFLGINVQTNSSNHGFNLATKYPKADFLSLNGKELKLIFHHNNGNDINLIKRLKKEKFFNNILLTLGKEGCLYYSNSLNKADSFVSSPKDTIGAGDAVFSLSSLLVYLGVDEELIPRFANAVGATAVNIVGNKESVKKKDIMKYLNE